MNTNTRGALPDRSNINIQEDSTQDVAKVELLVFDLDGTLIDSSLDLCNSVNASLDHVGHCSLSMERITGFIGDGVASLLRRSLAAGPHAKQVVRSDLEAELSAALPFFLAYYRDHLLDTTKPYPGVLHSLQAIRSRHPDLPMAVLTNKPARPSREICSALGFSPHFFAVYGGDSFAKKPDPQGLLAIIAEANAKFRTKVLGTPQITPERVVMVGDSDVDVHTARRCGARSLGCSYGLSPAALAAAQPDLMVNRAEEWAITLGL